MGTRLSGPERKASILEASQRLFADKGFHGVSIDNIADAVKVSPAILYRHFASKQELYNTILQDLSCQRESYVDTVINNSSNFEGVLSGMTQIFINSVADNPDLLRIEMQSMLDGNPATSEFFENRWKSFTDYIEFSLNEHLPIDYVNRETTILTAGLMFQGMVREALLQKFMQPHDRLAAISLEELGHELVKIFIQAIDIHLP
jgi:AcrR family transcriptional regulator